MSYPSFIRASADLFKLDDGFNLSEWVPTGKLTLITGDFCSGKSTLARVLADKMGAHYLYYGLDRKPSLADLSGIPSWSTVIIDEIIFSPEYQEDYIYRQFLIDAEQKNLTLVITVYCKKGTRPDPFTLDHVRAPNHLIDAAESVIALNLITGPGEVNAAHAMQLKSRRVGHWGEA